jgi:hypothetical protein
MASSVSTPLKFKTAICVICGIKPERYSKIEHSHLTDLLVIYCKINVVEGILCRNCARQLENINEKVISLQHKALGTITSLQGVKRQISSAQKDGRKKNCAYTRLSTPCKIPVHVSHAIIPTATASPDRSLGTTTPSKIPVGRSLARQETIVRRNLFELNENVCHVRANVEHDYIRPLPTLEHSTLPIAQPEQYTMSPDVVLQSTAHNVLATEIAQDFNKFMLSKCTCTDKGSNEMCRKCLVSDISSVRQQFFAIHHWKHEKRSVLISKNVTDAYKRDSLLNFSWSEIIREFRTEFSQLFYLLVGLMTPDLNKSDCIQNILPRIGMIYAIMLQTRASDMSILQRIVSLILLNANSEVHVSLLNVVIAFIFIVSLCEL